MSELLQKFEVREEAEEQPVDLSLLRLDSFNFTSPSADHCRHLNHSPCTACASSPPSSHHQSIPTSSCTNKRRTPHPTTSSAAMDHLRGQFPKKPRKLFSDYPQTPEPSPTASPAAAVVPSLAGFSKILLPLPFPGPANATHALPVFRRSVSDPTSPLVGGTDSVSGSADLAPLSPENAKVAEANVGTTPAAKGSAALPPMLRRSVSDPSPSKSFSPSDSSNDMAVDQSPHFQKLRWLREFFVEGNKLCNELMPDVINSEEEQAEEEEEEDKGDQDNAADGLKPGSMSGCCEEAISVERTGDCLTIQFHCPSGDVYQILLSGESCYYKLL